MRNLNDFTIKSVLLRYNSVLKRLNILIFLLVVAAEAAMAQYDVEFSHYFDMEPYYNAAAVGKQDKLNIVGAYSMQFAGFEHNPRTMFISADAPFIFLNSYHGAGVQILNDKLGFFTHQRIAVQYALKRPLFGGTLSVGVQGGLILEGYDGSDVVFPDKDDDQAFSKSDINGNTFDLGVGIYYSYGRWYVGASVQHITAPLVELGELNQLQIDRTYYLTGGYNIRLRNPFLTIPTSAIVRYDGTAYRADITARLVYKNENKMLYGGVGYSPTNSVTAFVGGSFHGINLGYSYEAYTTGIGLGHGSHELFVGYQIDLNLQKKGRNLHKSVRYL